MSTFVLVHGAWEGGWSWKWVAPLLRAAGHEVHAPTLTGLGERAHLLTRETDLETHVADLLAVLRFREIENATLVGHSYGGMVITGAADRAPERVGALCYLDAFWPGDGQSVLDLVAPERGAAMRGAAEAGGEGWYLPPFPAGFWHVEDPGHAAFLETFSTPHPLATMTQPLALTGRHLEVGRAAYVLATGYEPSTFPQFAERARAAGWPVEELPTHHFTMFSMPEETAEILIRHGA